MIEIAARFSEEDLTRYLQLSLDLFKDLAIFAAAAPASGNRACCGWFTPDAAADRRGAGRC